MPGSHTEHHRTQTIGWLRAAVLGANDGIVSTASLIIGVASSNATHGAVLVAGVAGLVAGAMSMAAGEYVSVSSQSDTEQADIARERTELAGDAGRETNELAGIYVRRGLDADPAQQLARQLMAKDALPTRATSSAFPRYPVPGRCRRLAPRHWHLPLGLACPCCAPGCRLANTWRWWLVPRRYCFSWRWVVWPPIPAAQESSRASGA